ncbi:tyrosyl-DNA phosphodiesterase-domain-containing protein [Dactylonectria macrodidyma]|uniref:Tyrosyl-DNA phosphodiesterase-domain-containing protein n=1 Tax=Dactylonectria macrodidyma TaxID=307937 RepID=A0A9P9EP31_9HYPO|nr:tyrosyl-DNA phosphodiesterase-domain-containing protein [Dactylonectria macrodidyma]
MTGAHMDIHDPGSGVDDDEALRYAIALSLCEHEPEDSPVEQNHPKSSSPKRSEPRSGVVTLGLLALDRKKMEEERLQRLAKRRRSASDDDVVEIPPPKRKMTSEPPISPSLPPFANGTVKKTWARGYPRTPDDIKIEEILQKDKLVLAVLSSYQWDDEWLVSKVDLRRTKLLLLAFAADENQKTAMRSNAPPGIKFCFPAMNGPGSMHSKLQLLKYPDYLRVAVPTGNLVPYDWGESGVMENMVFLIDLPRLTNSADHQPTMFSIELSRFLEATGVDKNMTSSLANYDFSRTKHLRFVYTIPGGHLDDSQKRIGYCGLGASVASLGLATKDSVEVDLVCASLGAINYDLVGAMYNACRGDDGMTEYNSRLSRATKAKAPSSVQQFKDHFRIYFPSDETVAQSRGGRTAAGTICIQAKWWRAPTFPTELVRDCVNTRDGLLMHSKMIFVRKHQTREGQSSTGAETKTEATEADADSDPGTSSLGWAYIGSANLSESAWGRLVRDRATGKPKMSCRNWECGVVIRVPGGNKAQAQAGGPSHDVSNMGIFEGMIPVPMRFPGRRYRETEEPWFYAQA